MIETFRHKGLKEFFLKGRQSKLNPPHIRKIRMVLFLLHNATTIEDCHFPGSGLHQMKGNYEGFWSVKISGNWRIIFRFEEGSVFDIDYVDYH